MVKIIIPKMFMGRERQPGAIERILAQKQNPPIANPQPIANAPATNGYVYVPALNLYVSKQRTLQNSNWYDCHKQLQAKGERMPTIPEFVEFLKYLKANPNGIKDASSAEVASIIDEILTVRNPYRAEWLDADFKVKGKKLYINYNHEVKGNKIEPKNSEEIIGCLMSDKTPGISLDSWLNNPTKQGLPQSNVPDGSLYYWYPRNDNNSVARFVADSDGAVLDCNGRPDNSNAGLGVRSVRSSP